MSALQDFHRVLRTDFMAFAELCFRQLNPRTKYKHGWHIELIADRLTGLEPGGQLIINVPPRSLKSFLGSVVYPAWLLGHNPSLQIICVSYAAELSETLSRQCRDIMSSETYRRVFPKTKLDRMAAHELTTTEGGVRIATSVDGVLTGRGADVIIVDDPLKPDEALSDVSRKRVNDWFDGTLFSRLNDKETGVIIIIMQRLHEDDLTGHLLSRGGWQHLKLAAIAEEEESYTIRSRHGPRTVGRRAGEALHPERESLVTLDRLSKTLGEYNFAGQYQQEPAPREGGLVKRGWFRTYRDAEKPTFDRTVQSWDTANKPTELADHSVCTTWGVKGKEFYLLHVFRKKLDYPDLKKAVRDQAAFWDASEILIEDKASGIQLIQELGREGVHNIRRYTPGAGQDKQMRMHAQTGAIENGRVFLPEAADWLDTYLHEITTFPRSKHDDQVDSTSQALHWLQRGGNGMGLFYYYEGMYEKQQEEERAIDRRRQEEARQRGGSW